MWYYKTDPLDPKFCDIQKFVEGRSRDPLNKKMIYSCLNLVDLAGSERLGDYDSAFNNQGETAYINKSLFILANVINKLAEGKR
jgi:hypothetical protein